VNWGKYILLINRPHFMSRKNVPNWRVRKSEFGFNPVPPCSPGAALNILSSMSGGGKFFIRDQHFSLCVFQNFLLSRRYFIRSRTCDHFGTCFGQMVSIFILPPKIPLFSLGT
jgi:hypothetical protein